MVLILRKASGYLRTVSSERRWKDNDIEGEVIGDQIDCDDSQRELIMKASEI